MGALSTTRQLRLIIVVVSLGLPELAFLHIILHGFFKALIFMGRGVAIHSGSSSQDVRTTNIIPPQKSLVLCFTLGNLGLMGFPFFGAFLRKHLLIFSFCSLSGFGLFILGNLFFSFSLTIGYSLKVFFLIFFGRKLPLKGRGRGGITILPLILLRLITLAFGGFLKDFFGFSLFVGGLSFHYLRSFRFILLILIRLAPLTLFGPSSSGLHFFFSGWGLLKKLKAPESLKRLGREQLEKLILLFSNKGIGFKTLTSSGEIEISSNYKIFLNFLYFSFFSIFLLLFYRFF